MDQQGKIVVVTGSSMGIGEAVARIFAEHGATVVLSSRDLGRVEVARSRIGHTERTLAVACDVQNLEDVRRLAQTALDRFGRIDVWVNNAGYGLMGSVASMDMEECRRLLETNLFGAIHGMQAAFAPMKRQRSGTVINISSIAGHIAVPYMAVYCASKHALNAVGKAARVELLGTGVHVMTVCPGYIDTDFAVNAVKGEERMRLRSNARPGIPVERVARAVLDGYRKNKREVIVPWRDRLVIKLYQVFPGLIEKMMARMLRPADEVIAEAQAAKKNA
ncbi:MAG: SDR family NAD(P)-dependent oxidoreductase [Terriglobales bacterium]